MWLRDHLTSLSGTMKEIISVLISRAEEEPNILMPGYTHLQRAQAIRWSHWLLSYAWSLFQDLQKLKFVFWSTNVCPLGSGALAGSPFPVDREQLANDLGFPRVTQNSLLAVADRDFVAEYLFWCSLTSVHLSRLAEDLILYSSAEFAFVRLSDAFSTGSSLMPQKKNPDSLELIRGKAGRMLGNVTGFLATMKGLPSTYNKDLQEDKELLFNSADTLKAVLQVAAGTISSLKVNKESCSKGLTEDMLATDLAYYLVRKGLPFRDAHGKAGEVVKASETLKVSLSEVPLEEMQKISSLFSSDVSDLWSFENSVEQYSATGGTSSSAVRKQIQSLKEMLQDFNLTTQLNL
ncbi:UNVERIFIED_CONTAM: hypothetical protein GTU68_055164 [Idotea baltica]|nr:hypothetical protein [Idotea baltica]MCL4128675.1 hypothetical protein [Idotea baltica]